MVAQPLDVPYVPTEEDRQWLRAQLGDTGTPPAISEDQLDALLIAHDGDRLAALADGLGILVAQAARFTDYSLGAVRENLSQVFDHLLARQKAVAAELDQRDRLASSATASVSVPTYAAW